mgnify:CR=1 FL=1
MLSRLDPLMKVFVRRVENPDVKMGIHRDESEIHEKRKRGEHEANAKGFSLEDTTEVSIEALRNFLLNLLYAAPAPENAAQDTPPPVLASNTTEQPHTTLINTSVSRASSHAAKAYQTTGRIVHDKNIAEPEKKVLPAANTGNSVSLGADFGEKERTQLEGFIADLQHLESQGRYVLVLQRSLTFIESIAQAIALAKGPES